MNQGKEGGWEGGRKEKVNKGKKLISYTVFLLYIMNIPLKQSTLTFPV